MMLRSFAYKIRAKVGNGATSGTSGLQWFKVSQNDLDSRGVDRMIANSGWPYFTMPSCVTSGQYLLRVEIIGKSICYLESFL